MQSCHSLTGTEDRPMEIERIRRRDSRVFSAVVTGCAVVGVLILGRVLLNWPA